MFDLREHKGLIRRLVSEANKNDANWHWSLKALSKTKASIFWEYLEYCEQPKPYFEIKVYTDEDNDTLIWAMDANSDGEKLDAEIVQSGSMFSGFPGNAWLSGLRLRHPLPLRYVQAEN